MAPSLLSQQGQMSNAEVLRVAEQAPQFLRKNPRAYTSSPLEPLLSVAESTDTWTEYENLLLACLRTGNDKAAGECLERIMFRFDEKDERVMALRGLVKEAVAVDDAALEAILKEYETVLKDNDANVPIAKRRVTLLRSLGRTSDAISALNSLLEFNTTDGECWAELAELYLTEGLYAQAVYSLEEVLALTPNAWNVHARVGEVHLMAADASPDSAPAKHLAEALKRFTRSVELCDDYLRGYYGLKVATDKLLSLHGKSKKQSDEGFAIPAQATLQKLNQLAVKKLSDIVRKYDAKDPMWMGYKADEVAAAKKLLEATASKTVR